MEVLSMFITTPDFDGSPIEVHYDYDFDGSVIEE